MPLEETVATYSYFITEADKLPLSYFTIMRYHPYLDVVFDGTCCTFYMSMFAISPTAI